MKTYIVAVSGGVDSVVLLYKLAKADNARLVVAHFDHGIRPDSAKDRKFVQNLAKKYGLSFEYAEGKLGPETSEAKARTARYKFLNTVKKKYQADAIITAHHQDDVIETAIINILRGTKSRGLSSLGSKPGLLRPLLKYTKFTIVNFANTNNLIWRDDPSNQDQKYLRNYVRLVLMPRLDQLDPSWRGKFLQQIDKAGQINQAVEPLLQKVESQIATSKKHSVVIQRSALINLPGEVGRELIRRWLGQVNSTLKIDQQMVKRAWLFAKTAKPGAKLDLSKDVAMQIDNGRVVIARVAK